MPDLFPPSSDKYDPPPYTKPSRSERRRRAFWITVVILIVATICGIGIPTTVNHGSHFKADAIGNIKQIGLALLDSEEDYGSYPNADTIAEVRKRTDTLLPLGTKTSNDYFRQLLAAGYVENEKCFYAKIKGARIPDNLIDSTHALEKGECGFSYIIGPIRDARPPQPLLVTPLIPGTDRFDPKPFGGKAIVFWTDQSASAEPIDKHGHVPDKSGMNLLDPANPIWKGKPPNIVWPDID